jgi:hypothetical protein
VLVTTIDMTQFKQYSKFQARALYDWEDMKIVRGDVLDILQKTNDDWWMAKKSGAEDAPGYVTSSQFAFLA